MLPVLWRYDCPCDMDHGQTHLDHSVRMIIHWFGHSTDNNVSITNGFHLERSIIVGLVVELNVQSSKNKKQNITQVISQIS